jgi:hypothetical protein
VNAVVLGNGESRQGIDFSPLRNNHTFIGCNAIHRDMIVDHLICCDRRMAEEATKEQNPSTLIYVREDWYHYFRKIRKNKNIRQVPDLPYKSIDRQDQPFHWGSGPYAILLAATLDVDLIKLYGFDLYGINNRVNNVYKGTDNYSKVDAQSIDPSYWIYQIAKVFEYFPNKKFEIYNHREWAVPREWQKSNVTVLAL